MADFADEVARMANGAVRALESRGRGAADFSEESVRLVEDALREAAQYRSEITDGQADTLIQEFGCYLLEVGRRLFGGSYQWHTQREQPVLIVGEPKFHVAIITWDKVRGRLDGDAADDIVFFFFEGFAERARKAEPGSRALYV